jgi:hypothetical protein
VKSSEIRLQMFQCQKKGEYCIMLGKTYITNPFKNQIDYFIYEELNNFFLFLCIYFSCRVMIGVHGGALTNMIFTQPDTVIFEIANFDEGDHANFFHACMANALRLEYHTVKPKRFSMWNVRQTVSINISTTISMLIQHIPVMMTTDDRTVVYF